MKIRAVRTALIAAMIAAACEPPLAQSGDEAAPTIPASTVQLRADDRASYEEAAAVLALRHVQRSLPAAQDQVELPAHVVGSLYNALVRVHGFRHSARDSVLDLYHIRIFPNPATRELVVGVDDRHAWVQRWAAEERLTGEPRIDALLETWDLALLRYYGYSGGHSFAVLRMPRPLNAAALARRFDGIPGVRWAEPNGYVGDGPDIRADRRGDGWRLEYSFGFGDCPAGCIHRTAWTFDVAGNGAVRYIGRSGDAPPPVPVRG